MKRMITAAAALLMSTTALPASAQMTTPNNWSDDMSLIAMEPAETSTYIRSIGQQDWSYLDLMANSEWRSAYAMNSTAMDAMMETASLETVVPLETSTYQGMGGPLEEIGTTSYPPCDPGPGDDRCIQLYERGVTGEAPVPSGVGGPYEEVAHEDSAMMSHATHQGVGGPIESQSGYPPCDPGPGDDRCIQLYEPGVTGAGN